MDSDAAATLAPAVRDASGRHLLCSNLCGRRIVESKKLCEPYGLGRRHKSCKPKQPVLPVQATAAPPSSTFISPTLRFLQSILSSVLLQRLLLVFSDSTVAIERILTASPLQRCIDSSELRVKAKIWRDYAFAVFAPPPPSSTPSTLLSPPSLDPDSIAAASIAERVQALVHKKQLWAMNKAIPTQSIISGGVIQTPIADLSALDQGSIVEDFHSLIRRHMHQLGATTIADPEKGKFTACKILVAAQGVGRQPIHWDSGIWSTDLKTNKELLVTCLLVCSPHTNSTLLPRFKFRFFHSDLDPRSKEGINHSALIQPLFFHSVPIPQGSMVYFLHAVPHAGVECVSTQHRVMLFDTLAMPLTDDKTKKEIKVNTDEQYFLWSYIRDACGYGAELGKCLLDNEEHEPIEREPKEKNKRKLRQLLVAAKKKKTKH